MIIGLLTSTNFPDTLKAAFLNGLRNNGWEGDVAGTNPITVTIISYEAGGNYDDTEGSTRKQLYRTVEQWDADPNINLIVAMGGLVAAHAAFKKCQNKPFIALYGTAPNFNLQGHSLFRGGVDLDLGSKNQDRNHELSTRFGLDPEEICLLWNSNSRMGKIEKTAWTKTNGWPLHKKVGTNDRRSIAKAFRDIVDDDSATGIVVSGDPYFTSQMDVLVAAANESGLKMCYPFAVYKNAFPAPEAGSGICLGPNLANAYDIMGQKAGTILTALNNNPSAPVPTTGVYVAPTGPVTVLKKTSRHGKSPSKGGKRRSKK